MLISLHIENIAVIKKVDIDFTKGFTALTGETGAGKSIILDSIGLLLGEKADKELIRHGENSCMVSGLFSLDGETAKSALCDAGISADDDGNILMQRSVTRDGKSQVKINGRTVNLTVLKSVSSGLVGIHGQNDTRDLSSKEKQFSLLDTYSGNIEMLALYKSAFAKYKDLERKISDMRLKISEGERMREILEYQINDIDSLKLHDGEEEELVEKKIKIKNSEKILKNTEFVFKALRGSEKGSVSYLIDRSITALSQLSGVVQRFDEYAETLRDVLYKVDDIAEEVYAVTEEMDSDPTNALNLIEERLDKITKLKRKYGFTVADILAFAERAREELSMIENSDALLSELEKEFDLVYKEALSYADKLHERRCKFAKALEKRVKETLEFLDMPKVVFLISIKENIKEEKKVLSENGIDDLEFLISANKGADAQSMSKIASGGELARIMLALKEAISDKDGIPTVIFDEIDSGVSGKTARKIGIKMLSLSKTTQIFCVTHSAQIASLSDTHYLISKSDASGKTETSVEALDINGRIGEISRILGGIDVTESQRDAARDMIFEKDNYC